MPTTHQRHFITLIFIISGWVQLLAQTRQITYYVAPWGLPGNPGTATRPFALPEQARDAIRLHKKKGQKHSAYQVLFRGGSYRRAQSLVLDSLDGGVAGTPVRWANYPGEQPVIHGGIEVDIAAFKRPGETAVTARFPAAIREKLRVLDLVALGIKNFGVLEAHGFGRPAGPAALELFIQGERQPLARYPNEGKMLIGPLSNPGAIPRNGDYSDRGGIFGYEDNRVNRWINATDIWLHGWFSFGFNDDHLRVAGIDTVQQQIQLAQAHVYGLKSTTDVDTTRWEQMAGHSLRGFYAYNIPEELDMPGEWWLDRQTGLLYLYPPDGFDAAKVRLSLLEAPLFTVKNTAWVELEGLSFQAARGMGIYLENVRDIGIYNCNFQGLGTVAISAGFPFEGGVPAWAADGSPVVWPAANNHFERIRIQACTVEGMGTGGILLQGGNRRDLSLSGNVVRDCKFRLTDERNYTHSPALLLSGVADTVQGCTFTDIRQIALNLSGNDHFIVQNHWERICTGSDDTGAIYMGRDPSARGTIIRQNHFKDILPADNDSQVSAVFLDDGTGGITVDSNYFERVGSQGDKQLFGAVAINGGFGNNIASNVFQDCEIVIGNNHWTTERWQAYLNGPLVQQRLTEEVDINSPLYIERYPELQAYFTHFGPMLNRVADNTLINSNMAINGRLELVFNHTAKATRLAAELKRIGMGE